MYLGLILSPGMWRQGIEGLMHAPITKSITFVTPKSRLWTGSVFLILPGDGSG